jgi:hypothetical protein
MANQRPPIWVRIQYSVRVARGATQTPASAKSNGKGSPSQAAKRSRKTKKAAPVSLKKHTASLFCSSKTLSPNFVEAVLDLEKGLERPVWMCIQQGDNKHARLGPLTKVAFLSARRELDAGGPVALLLESPGGLAPDAFSVARTLCRHAGGFTAVVPSYAKSAATLLSLGAERIIMGIDAEFGPLDAQLWDHEREEQTSALDEIQALERLHTAALEQLDETMLTMMAGTQKRTEVMLPIACRFVSDMMKPLLEKIDTVHYAKQSRILKVAEDYATRLLLPHHGPTAAGKIADRLVNSYPEHGFVIDRKEMSDLMGVNLAPPESVKDAVQRLDECLWGDAPLVAIGRLEEVE